MTFDFTVDAFPGYVKSNPTKQVLATIQILDADDNYDRTSSATEGKVTYKRYEYNQDGGAYLGTEQEGPVTKSEEEGDAVENGPAAGIDDSAKWT